MGIMDMVDLMIRQTILQIDIHAREFVLSPETNMPRLSLFQDNRSEFYCKSTVRHHQLIHENIARLVLIKYGYSNMSQAIAQSRIPKKRLKLVLNHS